MIESTYQLSDFTGEMIDIPYQLIEHTIRLVVYSCLESG